MKRITEVLGSFQKRKVDQKLHFMQVRNKYINHQLKEDRNYYQTINGVSFSNRSLNRSLKRKKSLPNSAYCPLEMEMVNVDEQLIICLKQKVISKYRKLIFQILAKNILWFSSNKKSVFG